MNIRPIVLLLALVSAVVFHRPLTSGSEPYRPEVWEMEAYGQVILRIGLLPGKVGRKKAGYYTLAFETARKITLPTLSTHQAR